MTASEQTNSVDTPTPPFDRGLPLCASPDGGYSAAYMSFLPGTFRRDEELDVIVYLLAGLVRVTTNGGAPLDVVPGEAVYLPRGSSALWEVHEATQKLVVYRAA